MTVLDTLFRDLEAKRIVSVRLVEFKTHDRLEVLDTQGLQASYTLKCKLSKALQWRSFYENAPEEVTKK